MALHDLGLRPSKITGASAGALIGAGLASGLEPPEIRTILLALKKDQFWDPGLGFGYLKGTKFLNYVRMHMANSFSDLKIPLQLAVFDIFSGHTRFLSEGLLPEAVVASCAVPMMFHPCRINGRWLWDGGLSRKSGMNHKATDERILCVFFESEGWVGTYDRNLTVRRLAPQHKIWRFKHLPRVSYNALHSGPLALEQTYERARQGLVKMVARESQIVDA